jgi:2'-5' RNA ligase
MTRLRKPFLPRSQRSPPRWRLSVFWSPNEVQSNMADTEFSLWLVPCEPQRSALRSTIQRLAVRLDAIEFEPHVTVFCGPSTDAEAGAVVDRIAKRFAPIELIADHLDHTQRYTKTLFLRFRPSVVLRQIFEMAAEGYTRQSNYALDPHLSLLYKKLPEAQQQKVCETLDVPMGNYWFDRIRLIETELPIEDAGPVKRWRTLCETELRGL